MKRILIFLGVPGSGKGTQANLICERLGYAHISTGDLLRALETDPSADPADLQKLQDMKAGRLVSDELIYRLAFAAIERGMHTGGVVLDGAIHSVAQAETYQQFFASHGYEPDVLAIEIAITDEEIMRRMESRVAAGKGRPDDTPEIIGKRIKTQGNGALQPIAAYYRSLGVVKTVDGLKSIEAVSEDIFHLITLSPISRD